MGYARNSKGWRAENVQVADERDLLPALVMRGRVRHAEQVRRHHGRLIPLEIAHDDFTTDIAENQLLWAACDVLLRLPGGIPADVRTTLLRQRVQLGDVTPIPRGHQLPVWHETRLNARFHDALRLADLVLRGASAEHRTGGVTVNGFLFNLATVFEDFVTVALRDTLARHRGHCILQASHHLDEQNAIRIVPDFVLYAADGTPRAVADAKYKAEKPEGFPDADLYQMLAYRTALKMPEGHLVYAKGNAPHGTHRVKHAGITIHQHALDLDQPPAGLLDDIHVLAEGLLVSERTAPAL